MSRVRRRNPQGHTLRLFTAGHGFPLAHQFGGVWSSFNDIIREDILEVCIQAHTQLAGVVCARIEPVSIAKALGAAGPSSDPVVSGCSKLSKLSLPPLHQMRRIPATVLFPLPER